MAKEPGLGSWLFGYLKKDVKVFAADRQAVVLSFVVPVMIASLLGWLDSSASSGKTSPPAVVDWVDLDQSAVSKAVEARLKSDRKLTPVPMSQAQARQEVGDGIVTAAVIVPKGFGDRAPAALTGGVKPTVEFLSDPAKDLESEIILGDLMQSASAAIAKQAFGSLAGDGAAPFVAEETHVNPQSSSWGRAAHDYAGFGMQGLLFFAMEAAVGLARERRLGIWRRLLASPVPTSVILLSRAVSSTLVALGIILAVFAVGGCVFGIRILGSGIGFFAIAGATAVMAATFGLLVSTIGSTETQSRGLSILLILVMLAIGGAWFPMQRMPAWVQSASNFMPVRWAVDGFDAMTWRGMNLAAALPNILALLGFAIVFGLLAAIRFRFATVHE